MAPLPAVVARLLAQATPMCPPRAGGEHGIPRGSPGCPDPFVDAGGWWTVAAVDVAALAAVAFVTWRMLRARGDTPSFLPQRRMLAAAAALLTAAIAVVAWPDVFAIASLPTASIATVGAFVLAGTALRPRGSVARGFVLGAATYVALGVAVSVTATAIVHRLVWTPFFPLHVVFWPDLLAASVGGYYTLV